MIEVTLPDGTLQSYPEAVLRRLLADGKVQPDCRARRADASDEAWSPLSDLLQPKSAPPPEPAAQEPALTPDTPSAPAKEKLKPSPQPQPVPAQAPPATTAPPASTPSASGIEDAGVGASIAARYQSGQTLVRSLENTATLLMILAVLVLLGFIFGAGTLAATLQGRRDSDGAFMGGAIGGGFIGAIFFLILKSWADMLRLQASLLAATIDTAVYTCPFISEARKRAIIGV